MTATTRPVRDDQHGTRTGYRYGCRCNECRLSERLNWRERGRSAATEEVVDRVLAALEHEADMDDLVTAGGVRLGELAGVSVATVNTAISHLADIGRIQILGHVPNGPTREIRLIGGSA